MLCALTCVMQLLPSKTEGHHPSYPRLTSQIRSMHGMQLAMLDQRSHTGWLQAADHHGLTESHIQGLGPHTDAHQRLRTVPA